MRPVEETSQSRNPAGLYRHKESGAEVVASRPSMADGFVRVGYKYVGPAPKKSVAEPEQVQEDDSADEVAELKKQLRLERANSTRLQKKLDSATDSEVKPDEDTKTEENK